MDDLSLANFEDGLEGMEFEEGVGVVGCEPLFTSGSFGKIP
jgi:hypothetical protein